MIDTMQDIVLDILHSADVDGYTNDQRKFLWVVAERLEVARAQQVGSGEAVAYRVTECPGLTYLVDTIEEAEHGKAFYGYGYEALYTHPSASRPNLTTIAQKKLDQMGATVHGVLVKNEAGAWAAVSDAGRVMWLDNFEGQAARQQADDLDNV